MDEKELLEEIEKLKSENKQKEEKLLNIVKTNVVRTEILKGEHKPHNVDIVMSLLKYDDIEVEDGNIVDGFDTQYKELVEGSSFLFKDENKGIKFKGGEPNVGDKVELENDKDMEYGKSLARTTLA